MELLKKIREKAPEYDSRFEDLIQKFTVSQGGRAGSASSNTQFEQGKFFSTKYEIYIYAALIGLKRNYKIPLSSDSKKSKFIEINSWKPQELADYLIMCAIAKSDIELANLEKMNSKELGEEILRLKTLLEEYANGGFDILKSKYEASPEFFENNENCFIDLME